MTSEKNHFKLNFMQECDQCVQEDSCSNGTLPNRLLSPITETSAEIHQTYSDISKKSPDFVLIKDHSTSNELNQVLLQKLHQYTKNFHTIQTYLNTLHEHFKALSIILEYLRKDSNILHVIEPIETRLLQMRAKRNQIDHLLNQSSLKTLIQQISPSILQSRFNIDYDEFLTAIQLNINQKTTLIDHLKNEYRYKKYQINEYASKVEQRHDLLIKLTNQIAQFIIEHDRILKQVNSISIINEHNRQCIELTKLSREYEQLRQENHHLTLKAKENLEKVSKFNHF
ncbi:hypothetical protein I4U23_021055 [Adineta vaga]|nr:hypothetical protein I4U23_021055 [Adineta vaga]